MNTPTKPRYKDAQKQRFYAYKLGTRVEIDGRVFLLTTTGSFWREEHEVPGNRVSRPSASLETLELTRGKRHVLLTN